MSGFSCPFCKSELNDGATVCHACGAMENGSRGWREALRKCIVCIVAIVVMMFGADHSPNSGFGYAALFFLCCFIWTIYSFFKSRGKWFKSY